MEEQYHRRSIRLKDYDYAKAGAYFVTTCTWQREYAFGEIMNGLVQLNRRGEIVQAVWDDLPNHYALVQLDAFVVMPNHIHAIIVLEDNTEQASVGAGLRPAPTTPSTLAARPALPEIVRAFKSFSARRINESRQTAGRPVWQRNYFEHVIRDERELITIRRYILNNPLQWALDRDNLANNRKDARVAKDYLAEAGVD